MQNGSMNQTKHFKLVYSDQCWGVVVSACPDTSSCGAHVKNANSNFLHQ